MSEVKNINPLIAQRESSRLFSGKKIEASIFEILFEAARWAPSSRNTQPWHFLLAEKDSAAFSKVLETLSISNQVWASKASAFVVVLADRSVEYQHLEYDLGQAVAYFTFQALDLNLNSRQMAGFDAFQLSQNLSINHPYQVFTVIAIGEKGINQNTDIEIVKKESLHRMRKSLEKVFTLMR